MVKVEVHFKGGSIMEVEVEDFETLQMGPAHKVSSINFIISETAKQYVPYLDFEEVAAVKFIDLTEDEQGEKEVDIQ